MTGNPRRAKTMRTMLKKALRDESGKVLILALIVLVVGGLIVGPLLGLMSTGLSAGQMYEAKTAGLYAADAGLEDAIHWLVHGKPINWDWYWDGSTGNRVKPLDINNRDVYVTVETLAKNEYKVTSVARGSRGDVTVVSTLWAVNLIKGCRDFVGPGEILVGDVYIEGDVSVSTNAQVDGNLVVDGDLTLTQGQTRIDGDVSVTGDITLEQQSKIAGNVCAGGDLILENHTSIEGGDVFVWGALQIANNCNIYGNVFVGGDIIFASNANSRIHGNVYAYGNITIELSNPNSEIFGSVYATGKVTVIPEAQAANIDGGIHQDYEEEDWDDDPPHCTPMPTNPTRIYTYEVG